MLKRKHLVGIDQYIKIGPFIDGLLDHVQNDITNVFMLNDRYMLAHFIFCPHNVGFDILNK